MKNISIIALFMFSLQAYTQASSEVHELISSFAKDKNSAKVEANRSLIKKTISKGFYFHKNTKDVILNTLLAEHWMEQQLSNQYELLRLYSKQKYIAIPAYNLIFSRDANISTKQAIQLMNAGVLEGVIEKRVLNEMIIEDFLARKEVASSPKALESLYLIFDNIDFEVIMGVTDSIFLNKYWINHPKIGEIAQRFVEKAIEKNALGASEFERFLIASREFIKLKESFDILKMMAASGQMDEDFLGIIIGNVDPDDILMDISNEQYQKLLNLGYSNIEAKKDISYSKRARKVTKNWAQKVKEYMGKDEITIIDFVSRLKSEARNKN